MLHNSKLVLVLVPVVLALDFAWLGLTSGFYDRELGTLARRVEGRMAPVPWAAALVWVLITIGIAVFVVQQVPPTAPAWAALGPGCLFGLVTYGVYDLTNYALVQGWSGRMVAVDMAWGALLCALAATAGVGIDRWLQ